MGNTFAQVLSLLHGAARGITRAAYAHRMALHTELHPNNS